MNYLLISVTNEYTKNSMIYFIMQYRIFKQAAVWSCWSRVCRASVSLLLHSSDEVSTDCGSAEANNGSAWFESVYGAPSLVLNLFWIMIDLLQYSRRPGQPERPQMSHKAKSLSWESHLSFKWSVNHVCVHVAWTTTGYLSACLHVEGSCRESTKRLQSASTGRQQESGAPLGRTWQCCSGGVGPDDRWKIRVIPRELCVCPCSCVEDSQTE